VPNGPIIIKKVSGHAGHHGGAWKVAYADFVTAMMSLFIVLWLLSSSKPVKEAVAGYFKDPSGTATLAGSSKNGSGDNIELKKDDMSKIKEALEKQIKALPDFEKLKKNIDMTITSEGLRIELTEDEKGTFFESGSAVPSANGKELLVALAQEVGKLPNKVSIEGHTDSRAYSGGLSGYGNWELSVDRGNAARRIVQSSGIRVEQVSQVRGFADQKPRDKTEPDDPSNRRISLIVQYIDKPVVVEEVAPEGAKGEGKGEGGKAGEGKPAEKAEHGEKK
jgi:chemotaxis protein MotB